MEDAWAQLIRAVPWGAVIIILRYLDIKEKADERRERDANAKDKAEQDRQNQITVSSTYASAINNMMKVSELSTENIVGSIKDMKEAVLDQYRKMGITQDLLEERFTKKD